MPNRIIKESICTSDEIDKLSPEQEVFFYRLMVNCDDYGLFDGRLKIIASKCYPLKSIDINSIRQYLVALHAVGLISTYEVDGKPFVAINKWDKHQQIRAVRAKYPLPKEGVFTSPEIICNQVISDAPVIQSNPIQSESSPIRENKKTSPAKPSRFDPLAIDIPSCIPMEVWSLWVSYRRSRKLTCTETTISGQIANLVSWNSAGHSASEIIKASIDNGWQGLFEPKKQTDQPKLTQHQRNQQAIANSIFGTAHDRSERLIEGEVIS